jgi:hypothetical protein
MVSEPTKATTDFTDCTDTKAEISPITQIKVPTQLPLTPQINEKSVKS